MGHGCAIIISTNAMLVAFDINCACYYNIIWIYLAQSYLEIFSYHATNVANRNSYQMITSHIFITDLLYMNYIITWIYAFVIYIGLSYYIYYTILILSFSFVFSD